MAGLARDAQRPADAEHSLHGINALRKKREKSHPIGLHPLGETPVRAVLQGLDCGQGLAGLTRKRSLNSRRKFVPILRLQGALTP